MNTLIKNGTIVNYDGTVKSDILVQDGIISKIDNVIENTDIDTDVIDAKGCFIFPGFIDCHTHPGLPEDLGYMKDTNDFYTETRAAKMGGTTTIFDFAEQQKGETLAEALLKRKNRYEGKAGCRYEFHSAVTHVGSDIYNELSEVKKLGVRSVKIYTTYAMKLNNPDILKVMECCRELDLIVLVHCEDDSIINYCSKESFYPLTRPEEAETSMIYSIVNMAAITGCKVYICHVSCSKSAEIIKEAKKDKLNVYFETCPQYLLLDSSLYYESDEEEMTKYILSPPLREKKDNEALVKACLEGTVDVISTDHCAFLYEKHKKIFCRDMTKAAKGMPGIQLRGSLMYDLLVKKNKMPAENFVSLMSHNEAQIFNLKDRGTIKEGMKGDIVVWKDEKFKVAIDKIYEGTDYSPYENMELEGKPQKVLMDMDKEKV